MLPGWQDYGKDNTPVRPVNPGREGKESIEGEPDKQTNKERRGGEELIGKG